MTYTGELTVYSCWCGIQFAVPWQLHDRYRWREVTHLWCPLGHSMIPKGQTPDQKIENLENALTREQSRHDQTLASLRATKGVVTRTKRRIAHGVCPCCKRTFANVARHMAGQHPDYGAA